MAHIANDGTPFTNRPQMVQHNNKLATKKASKPVAKPMDQDMDSDMDSDQPKDIMSDPEAMECIDKLKSMGYTADDVAQAMDSEDESSEPNTTGPSAGGLGQSLQLPPMGK